MDQSAHYYQLLALGRDAFLRAAAPAALVRKRRSTGGDAGLPARRAGDDEAGDTLVASFDGNTTGTGTRLPTAGGSLEVFPLVKKRGAPFADMITCGRTANNDVVIDDVTVSRFHAFFRQKDNQWAVADSGSKNGTTLDGQRLEPRRERPIDSGMVVKLGDVATTFHSAASLYDLLTQTK